uniref:Putative angiomotin-like protein 1 n=1 Tax=Xenopsylla cheopis TaxID=163159 RepID=A0A6M2DGK4_XENCH
MGSIKQPGRFMNTQQNAQRAIKSPGVFPQSLSGSETDVSTSNENLSHEERYVIRHTARVEPQGQETLQNPSPSPTQSPVINRLKSPNQNVPRKLESNIPRPFDMTRKMESNLPVRIKHDSSMSKMKETTMPRMIDNNQNSRNVKEQTNSLNRKDLQNRTNMENRNSISEISCSNRNSLKTDSLSNRNSLKDSIGSNRSSVDISSSSYNTLIIHNQDDSWNPRLPGHHNTDAPAYNKMNNAKLHYSHTSEHPTMPNRHSFENRNYDEQGMQEITDIPDDYLNQSHVLKHLAKEVKTPTPNSRSNSHTRDSGVSENSDSLRSRKLSDDQFTDCGDRSELIDERVRMDSGFGMEKTLTSEYGDSMQPPEYPQWMEESPTNSKFKSTNILEKASLSRSQPELSKLDDKTDFENNMESRPKTKGCEVESCDLETIEELLNENSQLKAELTSCYQKVAKSQKLEQEVLNIHQAHEELVQSCERRERLERAARTRLQGDCRRLNELNQALRDKMEQLTAQLLAPSDPSASSMQTQPLRNEINQREVLIAQLITQNKELVAAKERQEIELAAQRATLQEQRTHIDILDTALTNAQGNVVRLEEECRKKQMYVDRVAQLQRALSSLQLASDRREQTERKLRSQLESELRKDGATAAGEHELKRQIRERDEKIMRLEAECSKWEQRYLEESALRQSAIDAASIPKDAKIAALEKTSQETEKIIAEARSENIKQMDQVHAAQKRVHDLETRTKDLESKLAERDAMIRVLQKHVQTGPNLVQHMTSYEQDKASNYLSPHHTPHASLHNDEIVSSVLTTHSSNYGSTNSYSSDSYRVPSPYHHPNLGGYSTFDASRRSLDDQLKELDNQLLSKVGTSMRENSETFY